MKKKLAALHSSRLLVQCKTRVESELSNSTNKTMCNSDFHSEEEKEWVVNNSSNYSDMGFSVQSVALMLLSILQL